MIENPMIQAYLVYSGCGVGEGDTPITSTNVQAYNTDPKLSRKLMRQIRRLGLRVENSSPFGVRVCAPRNRFEEIFRAGIETSRDDSPQWTLPPTIPTLLQGMVIEVIFPQSVVRLEHSNEATMLP